MMQKTASVPFIGNWGCFCLCTIGISNGYPDSENGK
jgi:hypothetical protein